MYSFTAQDYRIKINYEDLTPATHLFLSAVAFLSVLQVAVAAALPPVHGAGVGQVEETLPSSGAQVAVQLLQVAAVEHAWKRMPGAQSSLIETETFPVPSRIGSEDARATYPVAAAMMQPPSSASALQQPAASWLMPKLWPISCAMVAATPTADSEWSCSEESNATSRSGGNLREVVKNICSSFLMAAYNTHLIHTEMN